MLNTININLKTDIKTDRPTTLGIKLMSQDKNNNQFILRFTNGGEPVSLDDTYTVEILTKFTKSGASRLTTARVRQDYATWEFDTAYITQDETVYNYVYVRKSGNLLVSADANCFVFSVDLSEIDKGAGKVAETYDENYEKYLDEFKDNVDFEEIAQAEQARKEAELLREESYEQKVDLALVEADVVEKVDNKVTELTPRMNELTAQLAQKVGGANKATMDDLGQDVKEALTGGAVAVVGVGAVGTTNVQTKAITPEKTDFITLGKNLLNKGDVVAGFLDFNNGDILDNVNYVTSKNFIKVNPGEVLTLSGVQVYIEYNSSYNYISGVNKGDSNTATITLSANTQYIKVSMEKTKVDIAQIERGSTFTGYEKYRLNMTGLYPIATSDISESFLSQLPTLTSGDDLNNLKKIGRWISYASANSPAAGNFLIDVQRYYYDSRNYYIKQTAYSTTNPTRGIYERMLYANGTVYIDWIRTDNNKYTGLAKTTIANFGDSIFGTYRNATGISNRIATLTGATVHNLGFGGCTMAQRSTNPLDGFNAFSMYKLVDAIITGDFTEQDNAISSDSTLPAYFAETVALLKTLDFSLVNYVTIAYGTNDFGLNVPIGENSESEDITTYKGALRYSLRKLMTAYPHLNIMVCTPIYRFWDVGGAFSEDSDTRSLNGNLLTDFVQAAKDVAGEFKTPYLDNYSKLGINRYNRLRYFTTGDGTHPIDVGRNKMAEKIAGALINEF